MINGKIVFILFLIIILGLFLFLFLNSDNNIKTEKVEKKRVVRSVYASGYVDSVNSVVLKPEVSGYIEKIYVKEGSRVNTGQLIVTISNEPLKKNLMEIRTQVDFVQNRLNENSDYQRALKEDIEIKRLNFEHFRQTYERRRELLRKGIISRESSQEAEKNYDIARKEYQKSLDNYNDAINSLKTELDTLKAKEEALVEELNKYSIRSPIDGEILRKFVNEGDYVNSMAQNNQLFSIGDTKNLETVLLVDEEYIPLIKEGLRVLVNTDAFPDKVFEGKIRLIEKESDRKTRTVKVKADVDYPENILIGVTVEANIILSDREGLFISKEAYKDGQVRVLSKGKAVKKFVQVGVESEDYIEVVEGLKEGQEIIIK